MMRHWITSSQIVAYQEEYGHRMPDFKGYRRGFLSPGFILSVHVGRIAPLGPASVPSAYVKHATGAPVQAHELGLEGDEQADRRVHGGVDKAVYAYPVEGYAGWLAEFPHLAARLLAPGMGENLSMAGLAEATVHIGDLFRVGGAVMQVTQPRQPCVKLAAYFGEPRMVKAMTRSGRCGWYLRVVEAGPVGSGDPVTLLDRPNPDWTVARFVEAVAAKRVDRELLSEMVAMPGLAANWQARAFALLARWEDGNMKAFT